MNNLIVLPMLLPLLAGILLIFVPRYSKLQRYVSLFVMLANIGISIYLLGKIQTDGILRLDFGGWEPPFGILFVADSFSVLLVLTSSIVTAACIIYAFSSVSRTYEKMFFYSFVNFLVAGVNGS